MMDYRMFSHGLLFLLAVSVGTSTVVAQAGSPLQQQSLTPGMTNAQGEEVVTRATGFAAVVTLDDLKLNQLMQQGSVEIRIPTQLINSVESVIVKRPLHFKNKKASGFADAELSGRRLVVKIDETVIERIDYQPVELKVYETGFNSVILRYVGTATPVDNNPGDPKTDSPILTVKLKTGNGIKGRIVGMKQLKMKSQLGVISVDFERTQRIAVKDTGEVTVEMVNGDLISGKINGGKIELITRWSTETIDLREVAALIVRHPPAQAGKVAGQMPATLSSPAGISSRQWQRQ